MFDTPMTIQVSVEGPPKLNIHTTKNVKRRLALELAEVLMEEVKINKAEQTPQGTTKYTTILQCDFI